MEATISPHIRVPAKSHSLQRVRAFCKDVLNENLCGDPQFLRQMVLAIDEAVANVIEHAFAKKPGDAVGTIEISLEIHQDRIITRIVDRGTEFDPRIRGNEAVQMADPKDDDGHSLPACELSPGHRRSSSHFPYRGYGRQLIHLIMDQIDYQRTPQGENLLVLTKLLPKGEVA